MIDRTKEVWGIEAWRVSGSLLVFIFIIFHWHRIKALLEIFFARSNNPSPAIPSITKASRTMDEIVKFAIPLLRNEKWQIRETIYCNRMSREKEPRQPKKLSTDGSLRAHHAGLLEAFRSELDAHLRQRQQRQCSGDGSETTPEMPRSRLDRTRNGDTDRSSSSSTSSVRTTASDFDAIRHNPELMMRIYSFLPLPDRICRLSLVDRAFARDAIRGGIVCATYGWGFNLKQALLELRHWAATVASTPTTRRRRLETISRMLDDAGLEDGEVLLYTGSNLTNEIVSPSERRRWMRSFAREFFSREVQRCEREEEEDGLRRHGPERSWLAEIVLVETFLKRYFFDGTVDRLNRLVDDAGFREEYNTYQNDQWKSKNHVDEDEHLVWCLPCLLPGCNLFLPDPDVGGEGNSGAGHRGGGWKEHRFVSCTECRKLHPCRKIRTVRCHHGQLGYFCDRCFENPPLDGNQEKAATFICYHCIYDRDDPR